MKKRIIALIVALGSLALVGCGQAPSDSVDTEEKVELRVLLSAADDARKQMNEEYIIPALEAEFPDYEIEIEEYVDLQKINTYNATDDMPDVFYTNSMAATLPVVNGGNALDLTSYITESGFVDKYVVKTPIEPWKDGAIYTLNSGADSYFTPRLFVNKSMFEDNGIAYPETYDELISVCEQFVALGITPMSSFLSEGWPAHSFLWQNFAAGVDPQTVIDFYNGEIGFTDPKVVDAFAKIEKLVSVGAFPEGSTQMDFGTSLNLFTSKQVPMYFMFTWTIADLEGDPDVDFIDIPDISSEIDMSNYIQSWGGPLAGYGVSADTKFAEAAVKVAEVCTFQEALFFNEQQKTPTALDTGVEITDISELAQKNFDNFEKAENKMPSVTFIYTPKTLTELTLQASQLMLGNATAQEVCEAVEVVRLDELEDE